MQNIIPIFINKFFEFVRFIIKDRDNGRILISNNDCETCIRPFAGGRKAWLFAGLPAGAGASGIVYTLAETAKQNRLDVLGYLCYLLESLPAQGTQNK
ncbi:MAG: IS66 family transposase [Eubacterium sp.]|nr:IS66 family transposase [Eubacterium sp.]